MVCIIFFHLLSESGLGGVNTQASSVAYNTTIICFFTLFLFDGILSTKTEEDIKKPFKASVYTGIAYIFTVLLLIFPYLVLDSFFLALIFALVNAIIVIFIFTFYISVARDSSFRRSFLEMTLLSFGIASFTFGMGFVVRKFFNVEI